MALTIVLKESSESETIVKGLRDEFGNKWYKDWETLVKDTNSIQRYLEGIAYEIVYEQIPVDDIIC